MKPYVKSSKAAAVVASEVMGRGDGMEMDRDETQAGGDEAAKATKNRKR